MSSDEPTDHAAAIQLQADSAEIAAIVMAAVTSKAERSRETLSGRHMTAGIEMMLAAAWNFAEAADDNQDGQRAKRYARLLRNHADSVEKLG
ncbi:hypothetical protein GCM10011371_08340 [Novosphingobium marinum]|uniref:Uncharacterized protein n=1 Tax=Novosphingobium marinum TaxID=1514948 RepID=A0A7Z0BUT7_9SPHN|nr:hypothetical protein [Novosphingobium marinum]NYH94522.1 hypothetical protein [Novosphingobium marinum]GGC22985.1 hypothetical protein GCM10011371_08340 [Novosphingobium marinum]